MQGPSLEFILIYWFFPFISNPHSLLLLYKQTLNCLVLSLDTGCLLEKHKVLSCVYTCLNFFISGNVLCIHSFLLFFTEASLQTASMIQYGPLVHTKPLHRVPKYESAISNNATIFKSDL